MREKMKKINARIFCQDTGEFLPEFMNCEITEPTETRATISFTGEPTTNNSGYEVKLTCGTTGWVLWSKAVGGARPLGNSQSTSPERVRTRFRENLSRTLAGT
jgi:hypothetical protein